MNIIVIFGGSYALFVYFHTLTAFQALQHLTDMTINLHNFQLTNKGVFKCKQPIFFVTLQLNSLRLPIEKKPNPCDHELNFILCRLIVLRVKCPIIGLKKCDIQFQVPKGKRSNSRPLKVGDPSLGPIVQVGYLILGLKVWDQFLALQSKGCRSNYSC